MTLNNSEPPALSHGSTQTNLAEVDGPTLGLFDRIRSLKNEATNILETTTWPGKSAAVAQEFLKAIKNTPNLRNIPERAAPSSPDLQNDVQKVITVLEDVRKRLESASSEYGAGKEGFSGSIKDTFSWGAGRSSKILRSCREDVEKAWTPLHRRLTNHSGANDIGPNSQVPQDIHFASSEAAPGNSTVNPPAKGTSAPSPGDQEGKHSVSPEVLNTAGKIFTAVEAASVLIPIVGSYVGAAAKVGSAVVEMVQKMDENEQIAKELESRVSKLSDLIEYFKGQSARTGGEHITARIKGLKSEITDIQKQVDEWKSIGKLKKAWSATDDSDAFNASVSTVESALAEMQVLASLNITDLLDQLYTHNLLSRLGDGDYGAQGKSSDNATCLIGTRVDILTSIDAWVEGESTAERVLWIRGMAGRGKSTIARTVTSRWKGRATCATFHVRRGRDATNVQFVCAIARQLALSPLTEVATAILASVRVNENIAHQPLEDQFQKLLIEPFESLNCSLHPIILVVDALDEFQDTQYPVEFIDLIHDRAPKLPANVKFLLTSRPETTLLNAFRDGWQTVDLDTIPDTDVNADIKLFVEAEFSAIRQKRGKKHRLDNTWPSTGDIDEVVKMSQGLFQWARTAMAYIGERSPDLRLREFLGSPSRGGRLDDLYLGILSKAFNTQNVHSERRELLSWVLGTLVVTPHPVTLDVVAFLYADHVTFDGQEQDQIVEFLREDILGDLTSLVHVPENASQPMRLLHTSIRDFLIDQKGSSQREYGLVVTQDHRRLLDVCLRVMGRDLQRNICNLSDLSKPTSEIGTTVGLKVSQGLRHCCRSWSAHLTAGRPWKDANATAPLNLPFELKPFSEQNILKWLEIMSLTGATNEAWVIAHSVWQWLLECPGEVSDSSLITLWGDTQRFIAMFHDPISYGVPHIYASALAHCPVRTKLWEHYGSLTTVHVPKGLQMQVWPSNVWTKLTDSVAFSVAFSPDGKTLASGSSDETIQLWNAQTGSPLGEPLKSHSDWVWSVAFSPDGKTLASGSRDQTIRLWNAQTGSPLGEPLQGHSDGVRSVAFSPDGKTLASGSDDQTIRLWNVQTGSPLGEPLKGHSNYVMSVAFSPDGKTLASGSDDGTIRLWNAQTGSPLGEPLQGHSSSVTSVAFSPDGKTLASGSWDGTIRLWNAQTRSPLGEPLKSHSGLVWSVTFSPDGKALASGSSDQTIRLWEVQTGSPMGEPLKGHSHSVSSVAFSPDGKTLASGSWDRTIRLWNAQTGSPLGEPLQGHSDEVKSVAFSPDGKTFASGSSDHTIRLWNAQTGSPLGEPLKGHSDRVTSVAFSPDGKMLASGSWDKAIRLWNAQTGSPLGEPLKSRSSWVTSVAFSPDGKTLASGSESGKIRFWNAQTGSPLSEHLRGHSDWVRSVAFSPDGKTFASGSDNGTIRLWNAQTRSPLGEPLKGHEGLVTSVAFSPDGKTLASGSSDGTIRLWNAQTRSPLDGPSNSVGSVTASPNGKLGARIHEQSSMRFTSWPQIDLGYQGQWLTFDNDRFLWLPGRYWSGHPIIAKLCKGTVAFTSDRYVSFFDVSGSLGLPVD